MSYLLWHVIGDMTGNWVAIHDEEKDDRTQPQVWWNYQFRMPGIEFHRFPFTRLWPMSRLMQGDPTGAVIYPFAQDNFDGTSFGPWTDMDGGTYRPGYLVGQCTTSGAVPLVGATVSLYLSSSDQFVSTGVTDSNGNYMLPTPFLAQNHFIYANWQNGTFVGASVDTLQPNA